ncbi:outer membrane beta-barrel domain-containing protein [Exilibacterium tricleocarpae]|uniref:Outer membrane beta-barrel domain-containing protein n=1 Tax=Exilibacterium tricleocarpae TaxID=2591008 RepID=A0A545TAH8_9GAMM|nr:outer membrane beta-barrel domain-containing protein [Exilibacterium tricleocarpae]TQV74207.1 outer membrane beta-barrel domain-containing protein [Exilibacterium tricleocarpae]
MVRNMLRVLKILPALLVGTGSLLSGPVYGQDTQDNSSTVTIIQPDKEVKKAEFAEIDTERFELGVFGGTLSVEDFGNSPVMGFTVGYHINPRFMAQVGYGQSDVGRAAFEEALGADFLSESDKEFTYTSASLGYRLFYGRSFFGARNKFNSRLYLIAGVEDVEFAGESNTGIVLGTTYKIIVTDWLTWNIDLRNHIFDREFLADEKTTQNVEFGVGFTVFF